MGWDDWIRTTEIEPSLYAADFSILGEQIRTLLGAGCRVFHFDVGDGHFVEPITMGPIVLQSISGIVHESGGAVDVHMMVENPAKYFAPIADAGGDSVTVHYEACDDLPAVVRAARSHKLQVALAFKPETSAAYAAHAALSSQVDMVLGDGARDRGARCDEIPELLPGVGYVRLDGMREPVRVRASYLSDERIRLLAAKFQPTHRHDFEDPAA